MIDVVTGHTGELDPALLAGSRALLDDAFDDMTDDDWEHCLGGMHVVAREGATVLGHAALVQRRLLHGGRALRTGYVEGVAVRADVRGHGIGARIMDRIERLASRAYDVAALAATDEAAGFYAARGWHLWRGPTSALTPAGLRRTPDDDGAVYVLPYAVPLDLEAELVCDWRDGDVW